jgi:isonocardicin synthase
VSVSAHLASERSRADLHHRRIVVPGQIEEVVEPDCSTWQYWFVLAVDGEEWIGRKFLVEPTGGWWISSIVRPWMLLGRKMGIDTKACVASFRYRVAPLDELLAVFLRACRDPLASLHFPYPCMDAQGKECVMSTRDWTGLAPLADKLDSHEEHFRLQAIDLLKGMGLAPGARVYDPACSTGAFIAAMASALPDAQCVGSDLSSGMIELARRRFDHPNLRFEVCDALASCCEAASCDVVFVRFLNAEVVPQGAAMEYFRTLRRLVRRGGRMVVFGHTPVMFAPDQHASGLGLMPVSNVASLSGGGGLFQFYVLEAID